MRSVGTRHLPVTRVAVAVALALQGAAAWADLNGVASFNIPAQPLSTALIQFSNQADVQVVSNADQLGELTSAGLSGKHSGREALQLLLREHSLQFQEITNRSVRIMPVKVAAAGNNAAAESEQIEEVVVQSTLLFVQNDAFGATKMGLSILDTPQTVSVITEDMMELMNVNTLDDINRVLPGSSRTFDFVGNQNFYFRGFQVDLDTGLRIDGFRFDSENQLNPALFERIEVIQGATSTMYGQNTPAGMVNAVSKIPQPTFKAEVGLEGGSNEFYDVDGDVTGPLLGSDKWSYRLLGNYQSYGTHWDQVEDDRWIVSPSVRYQDENTNFIARFVYQEREATQFRSSYLQFDRAVPGALTPAQAIAAGAEIVSLKVPNSRFLGMPWGFQNEDILTAQTQLDHTFDNRWTVRGNLQYSREGRDTSLYAVGGPFASDGRAAYEYVQDLYSTSKSYSGEVNLYGPFQAFGREHTAFIGIDYGAQNTDPAVNLLAYTALNYGTTRFNAFTPDYGLTTQAQADAFMATQPLNFTESNDKYLGITAQVMLKPIDRLTLSLGGRYSYDTVKTRTGRAIGLQAAKAAFAAADATLTDFDDFVHQIGATFEVADHMNLYASYGQGFSPVTNRRWVPNDPSGELIGAELSRNYEVGFKADFNAGWGLRVALFDTRRTNISQSDPDLTHTCGAGACSLPIGEQVAQGVEGVIQGRLTPAINAFLAASYLDTFYKGDLKGIRPNNTPRFSTSAFASYEFLESKLLRGLGVSLGVTYKTDLVAPDTTLRRNGVVYVYEVGDVTEMDARVFYNWQNMNFYLLATNVLDEQYVAASNLNLGLNMHTNPGREYRAGVKWKF
jgi:TonB-dependent siderophore receptor